MYMHYAKFGLNSVRYIRVEIWLFSFASIFLVIQWEFGYLWLKVCSFAFVNREIMKNSNYMEA